MDILDRLEQSFTELETAIRSCRETLVNRKPEILPRVDQYDQILTKQRTYAKALKLEMERKNWDEVSRLVSIINGLSGMIRDDASEILATVNNSQTD